MKKIGIITGSDPEAVIDFWTKLLKKNRELVGLTSLLVEDVIKKVHNIHKIELLS